MSTYYRPTRRIHIDEYKKVKGLKIYDNKNGTYMKAGKSYIHFSINTKGEVIDFYRYNTNDIGEIFNALISHPTFNDIELISEYEDDYHTYADEDTAVKRISIKDLKPIAEFMYDKKPDSKIVRKKKLN